MNSLRSSPLVHNVLAHLQASWADIFPGERKPKSLEVMLQGTGVGKLIVFVFADGAPQPVCVVKLPRSTRDNASLRHEYELVGELLRRAGPAVQEALPAPLAAFVVDGWQVTVEKMLPGQLLSGQVPLGAAFNLDKAARHLRLVREWLVAVHRATAGPVTVLTTTDVHEFFLQPIARTMREAELRPHEIAYLGYLQAAAQRLIGCAFPMSFSHGDLRPGNILLSKSQLRVIDWQFGQARAVPMLDWFEFAFRYFCDAQSLEEIAGAPDAYRAAFEAVYLGSHRYSDLVAAETQAYAQALGIPSDSLSLLLGLWLVSNTNKYLTFLNDRAERGYLYLMQTGADDSSAGFRRQLRRQVYVFLLGQLALDHNRHSLFYPDSARVPRRLPSAV